MTRTHHARTAILAAAAFAASSAGAHEGHGVAGTHWHSTDVWGFVLVALIVAGALAWKTIK